MIELYSSTSWQTPKDLNEFKNVYFRYSGHTSARLLISSVLLCLFSHPLLFPLFHFFHFQTFPLPKGAHLPQKQRKTHYYLIFIVCEEVVRVLFWEWKVHCVAYVLLSSSEWSSNSCSAFNVHNYREHAEEDAALNLKTGSKRVVFTTLA